MSLNTAHYNDGIIIHKNEWILLYGENAKIEFSGNDITIFGQRKIGKLFLTTHRLIFHNDSKIINKKNLKSFSMPLYCLENVSVENLLMDLNVIKGIISAGLNDIWKGVVTFKIYFESAKDTLEFGNAILKAIDLIKKKMDAISENCIHQDNIASENTEINKPLETETRMHLIASDTFDWLPTKFIESPPNNAIFIIGTQLEYPGICSVSSGYKASPTIPNYERKNNSENLIIESHSTKSSSPSESLCIKLNTPCPGQRIVFAKRKREKQNFQNSGQNTHSNQSIKNKSKMKSITLTTGHISNNNNKNYEITEL